MLPSFIASTYALQRGPIALALVADSALAGRGRGGDADDASGRGESEGGRRREGRRGKKAGADETDALGRRRAGDGGVEN